MSLKQSLKDAMRAIFMPLYKSLCGKKPIIKQFRFEVHLTDECNLNCAGCSHFAPLAEKGSVYPLVNFKKDVCQLSKILDREADCINLLGGEPLLNEDLMKYIQIARECFPNSSIFIVSNGILIKKMSEAFWDCCRKLNVTIAITIYPIDIDYDSVLKYIESKGCKMKVYGDRNESTAFRNISLNKKKPENYKKRFYDCWIGNRCINLKFTPNGGRLYPCSIPAYIHIYNSYFGQEFEDLDRNSIDIYNTSKEKLLDFCRTPIPFCSYCDSDQTQLKWKPSRREKAEWNK